MGCDTVFAHPCNSDQGHLHWTVLQQTGRRITLQPNLSVATRPTLYMRRLAPHSTLTCPRHHRVPIRIGKHIACLAGKPLHVMDVSVVFHVQFKVLLAHGIDLHLYGICDTVQANRGIWNTDQQRDKRVGFQFLLVISALASQYTNRSVLSCHVHQLRGVTRCASRDRASMRKRRCKRQLPSRIGIVSQ